MIREILAAAHRFDHWLRLRVGRLYTLVLAFSLVAGIGATARSIGKAIDSPAGVGAVVAIAVQAALLVNQLAQLHEYREAAAIRRQARRREKPSAAEPAAPAEDPPAPEAAG